MRRILLGAICVLSEVFSLAWVVFYTKCGNLVGESLCEVGDGVQRGDFV